MFNIQFKKNLIEKMNKSLFYKERKRMQRLFHSFEKNGCFQLYLSSPETTLVKFLLGFYFSFRLLL